MKSGSIFAERRRIQEVKPMHDDNDDDVDDVLHIITALIEIFSILQ
jgi:hypothetical protein